jgi:hypothetical protein
MKNQSIVISISTPDQRSMTICLDQHAHISEWESIFKTLLTFLEFAPQNIEELFAGSVEFGGEDM